MGTLLKLDTIEHAIDEIRAGRPVIVVDDENRENEGDLILAAEAVTPELMAFFIRYTSGVVCVPMTGADLDRLHLPLMTAQNAEQFRTAYTVTVDAREGVSTGISAADRARTIRLLADPASAAGDFVRPGHILPLRGREGGVLVRPGHTEASLDLARLAGLRPAGVLAELVNDDGTMMRGPQLRAFADEHGLVLISIEDLIRYRRRTELHVERVATTILPTAYGDFVAYGYRNTVDGSEQVALVRGEVTDGPVLARLHSECLTGDVFGSQRCDCGPQLQEALRQLAAEGGVLVYLRGHEGRGIGLLHKLRAYALQDEGRDTVDANLDLGLPADARDYAVGAHILGDLGVKSVRLLTNNPDKVAGVQGYGIDVVERRPLSIRPTRHNVRYLRTKRERMGHYLPVPFLAEGKG